MQWRQAFGLLDEVTRGIGHPEHFRKFRMQITVCKHVPLLEQEIEALPATWHDERGHTLAGGPVESLDSVGLPPGLVSAQPCVKPGKNMLSASVVGGDPDAWLPVDCGVCPSCMARTELANALGVE